MEIKLLGYEKVINLVASKETRLVSEDNLEAVMRIKKAFEQALEGLAFYIWSNDHNLWWKPNKIGYTQVKNEAGIYTFKEALEILKISEFGASMDSPKETIVPCWRFWEDILV